MKELITQEEWDFIKDFLPQKKAIGGPRVDDKKASITWNFMRVLVMLL